MNLCIVSFQAVLLAILVVQYHYINEVEAEKLSRYPNENWFNSVEKRIEIVQNVADPETQIMMEKEEAPKRKKKIIKKHKKKIRAKYEQHEHVPHDKREHVPHEKRDHVPHEEREHVPHEKREQVRHEKREQVPHEKREQVPHEKREQVPQEYYEHIEHDHAAPDQNEHAAHERRKYVPHEPKFEASVEQEKEDYGEKVVRKNHIKREKEFMNQRKFVKAIEKESNSSESEEVKRRKPVDIIVHIKMNE